ncbi:hypothetical protein BHE74_00032507 [Ensete ventricosum]|nr:hypothetical protein GW17_00060331 [Ensete ventricosum]RWW60509.1 hypothetical protein BHE74_00032507 [Ensete ventricosum]
MGMGGCLSTSTSATAGPPDTRNACSTWFGSPSRPTALRASSSSSQSGACCGDYKVLLLLSTPPTACASSDHQPTIFLKTSKEEKEGRKRKTQDMMGVGCNPIDLRLRLGSSSGYCVLDVIKTLKHASASTHGFWCSAEEAFGKPNAGFADSSEYEMVF